MPQGLRVLLQPEQRQLRGVEGARHARHLRQVPDLAHLRGAALPRWITHHRETEPGVQLQVCPPNFRT